MTDEKAKRQASQLLPLVLIAGAVAGVYVGTENLGESLRRLPVHDIGQARTPLVTISSSTLYPVWIKRMQKAVAAPPAEGDYDATFMAAAQPTHEVPPIVDESADLAHRLEQQLTLDGLTNNGAIISGRFVERGEKLAQFAAHDTAGRQVEPQLIGTSATSAQLRVGDHVITLRVPHAVD